MKWLNQMKTRISKTVKQKGEELYAKASPKVQKEIDKIITTKAEDIIETGSKVLGIGIIIIFAIKAVNSHSEVIEDISELPYRTINIHYDEVNITNNYYSKED